MPMIQINDIKQLTLAEGVTARVVHTGNFSVAHVKLTAGAVVPEHAHHHEQVTNLIEGELELTLDGEKHILTPGCAVTMPPMAPHFAVAKADTYVIDVFHPVREDLRALE